MNISRRAFGGRFAACALSLATVTLSLDSMPVRAAETLNVYSIWPENW